MKNITNLFYKMFTETQITEIRNYLLSKKLPIDILIEVNDHFISQISDLQREENLSFEEAFEKTKLSWDKELKPYWRGNLNLEDISDFMVKTKKEIDKTNLFFALKYSTIPTLLIFIIAFNFKAETFGYLTLSIIFGLTFYTLIKYFSHYQDFKLAKKYTKHIIISIQEYTMLSIGGIYFYFRFLVDGFYVADMFKDFFYIQNFENFIFGLFITFTLLFVSFLSIFSQKIYLKKIEKVKPFLKYL